ncbi:MAG: putative LPS assembly protein LptD, partial [Bacteroidota bacterium]
QRSTYNKRYAYRGAFSVTYAETRTGQANTPEFSIARDFNVSWNHNQAASAHPSRRFTAGVDFGSATFLTNTQNDANSVLTNTIRSNASITKNFPGREYSLSASFAHSLNTRTRLTNINLPQLDFRLNQIFPFERKSKKPGKKDQFYENIGVRVTSSLQNTLAIPDTSLFTRDAIEAIRFGVEHRVPVSASWRVFKFFNLSPSVNYIERWHLETLEKEYDPTLLIENDTIFNADGTEINQIIRDTTFGQVIERDLFGFAAQRQVTASLNLTTKLFGNINFGSKRKIQAIRHVLTPSIGFTITPDYTKDF